MAGACLKYHSATRTPRFAEDFPLIQLTQPAAPPSFGANLRRALMNTENPEAYGKNPFAEGGFQWIFAGNCEDTESLGQMILWGRSFMEFYKNQIVTVVIEHMGNDGEGIGKIDGYTLFIKDAVAGDRVQAKIIKAKKNYGFARLMNIEEPSRYRVEPPCAFARQCGGCQLQALSYSQQLKYKEEKVRNNLEHIGGLREIPMEPVIGMEEPFHYRNKAQFPIGMDRDGHIITGFYASRSHTIIPNRECLLGVSQNEEILDILIAHMEKYHIAPYDEINGKGLVRHVLLRYGFHTGEIMVCLILNGSRLPGAEKLADRLFSMEGMTSFMINVNKKRDNVILGDRTMLIRGKTYITDYIKDLKFCISPASFFQVNPHQTGKMYEKALEYAALTGEETVWDLYCGIGTISLFLARAAKKVYGVEVIPQAIEDARENARLNHLDNVEFFVGKAEEIFPDKAKRERVHADVIVVDPPRKGCGWELLDAILHVMPPKVVYVSCDSATLARDVKYLAEGGYEVVKVCPFDNFAMTVHVETIVLLSRR